MDIIKMTRELGKAIQQDERYTAYMSAKETNDKDAELQQLIGDFNLKRMNINAEMTAGEENSDRLKKLNEELKEIYSKIMANENMAAFNTAQSALEQLISDVNQIISMCANGEDPDTCQISHGCSGSCATCGGCG